MKLRRILFYAMIAAAFTALFLFIGGMVYVVKAKYALNDYTLQVGLGFNAAMMVNAEETHTDADKAVIAEYEGRRVVIAPENYKAVQTCLLRQAAMPLFGRVRHEGALRISLCGEAEVYIQPDEDGEGFTAEWTSSGKRFVMHAAGGGHWQRMLTLCLEGSTQMANIEL